MRSSSQRPLAPHVQAAIAKAAQPKMAPAAERRPVAAHVQRAMAAPIQAKAAVQAPAGHPLAPHVQRAVGGPAQAKPATSTPAGRQVAAHVQRAVAGPPAVQRKVSYRGGSQSKTMNPIDSLLTFQDFGVTPVIVNAYEIPPSNNASRILTPPDLNVQAASNQTSVSIRAVATQNVGYRMELPVSPPWSRNAVAKNHLKSAVEMQLGRDSLLQVPIASSETGTINLELKGEPDDQSFADMVERHEKYHVKELKDTIEEVLQPWDTMLQLFQEAGTQWTAATREEAETALYHAVGGTPRQIGERFVNALRDKGVSFHETATGGSPSITGVQRVSGGATLRVFLRHPVALERWHASETRREQEEQRRQEAMDRSARMFRQAPNTVSSSSEGNRYILNDML